MKERSVPISTRAEYATIILAQVKKMNVFDDKPLLQLIAHGPGRTGATAQKPAKTAQRRGIGRFFRKQCMVEDLALSMSRNMRCATWMYFVQVSFIKQISSSLLQWIVP